MVGCVWGENGMVVFAKTGHARTPTRLVCAVALGKLHCAHQSVGRPHGQWREPLSRFLLPGRLVRLPKCREGISLSRTGCHRVTTFVCIRAGGPLRARQTIVLPEVQFSSTTLPRCMDTRFHLVGTRRLSDVIGTEPSSIGEAVHCALRDMSSTSYQHRRDTST